MQVTFPDSKRTIELEGLSFLTVTMIRGWYEKNYPNKPVVPQIKMGDELEDNPNDKEYVAALGVWNTEMNEARWAAQKAYYASCVVEIDTEAVNKAAEKMAPYVNIRETILEGYTELKVPFDPDILDKYIYLWYVCVSNVGEQTILTDSIITGSSSTKEVVDQALFRLRTQVQ